jgi:hypothetical protein
MVNSRVYVLPCGGRDSCLGQEAIILANSEDDKKYIVEYEDGKVAEVNKWQCKFMDEVSDLKDAEEFAKKRNYEWDEWKPID